MVEKSRVSKATYWRLVGSFTQFLEGEGSMRLLRSGGDLLCEDDRAGPASNSMGKEKLGAKWPMFLAKGRPKLNCYWVGSLD